MITCLVIQAKDTFLGKRNNRKNELQYESMTKEMYFMVL